MDLNFKGGEILCQNFLNFNPKNYNNNIDNNKYLIIGNPPFGLRGNLALRFINHSASFADFIGFILPPLFDSDGKGAPKKRVKDYVLVHSEKLPPDSFIYPDSKPVEVATLWQIWAHKNLINNGVLNISQNKQKSCKNFIKIYSLSDGGTPSSTRNKNMLDKCDIYVLALKIYHKCTLILTLMTYQTNADMV